MQRDIARASATSTSRCLELDQGKDRHSGGILRCTIMDMVPMRPVTDHAEVSIDFPEKTYMGSFGRTASFAASATPSGVDLKLAHGGYPKRSVDVHLHWYLFAHILDEIAASLEGRVRLVDEAHRTVLAESVKRMAAALAAPASTLEPT